jgi:hypothetical protein
MMSADEFERQIKGNTNKGAMSRLKGPGRTKLIAAALRAYEESGRQRQADAERAAYLWTVIKNCKNWKQTKKGDEGDNTGARMGVVDALLQEAQLELRTYPLVNAALQQYQAKKFARHGLQTTALAGGIYAHEGRAYREQKLKAKGQFVDPGMPNFVPSATLMKNNGAGHGPKADALWNKVHKNNITFEEYMKLDCLLGPQYRVLYLSKLQRLKYMVSIENGSFWSIVQGGPTDMPNSSVNDDLGVDNPDGPTYFYACDRFGNLFIARNGSLQDERGKKIQLNHSTLLAGREVLCAGTISIKNGILRGVSNLSGHYLPDTDALTRFLVELKNAGVRVETDGTIVVDMKQQIKTFTRHFMKGDYADRSTAILMRQQLSRQS